MRFYLFILFCFILVFSCSDDIDAPISEFYENFDDFPDKNIWSFELQESERFELVTDPVKNSKKASKITLKPGDLVANGNRAEMKVYPQHGLNEETFISYSVYIPESFRESAVAKNSRHMITQFHEQPPERLSFAEFSDVEYRNYRPSVAINLTIEDSIYYLCAYSY